MTAVPDWIIPGTLVLAGTLERITADYGRDVALLVDEDSHPCERCARNTYGGGLCLECAEYLDATERNIEPAIALEAAGTFSPQE